MFRRLNRALQRLVLAAIYERAIRTSKPYSFDTAIGRYALKGVSDDRL